ncbi:DNA helicase, partial [Tanacetum coccineum]
MEPHTAGVKSSTVASKVPLEYKYLGRCTCVSITVVQCFGSAKRLPTYHPEDSQNIINAALEGASFYQFPLLFVYGEEGYHKGLKLANSPGLATKGGKLNQQYVVTAYCAIEQNRLDYIRQNQSKIRNEYLSGLYDAIIRGDRDGSDLGTRLVLSSSFTGGPRYMYSHYLDALAICRVHGNPS